MNILSRWLGHAKVPHATRATAAPTEVLSDEGAPGGCGWFDSSHELQHGLWVLEHASPDELAAVLPLACWLELHLTARQGRPRA